MFISFSNATSFLGSILSAVCSDTAHDIVENFYIRSYLSKDTSETESPHAFSYPSSFGECKVVGVA